MFLLHPVVNTWWKRKVWEARWIASGESACYDL